MGSARTTGERPPFIATVGYVRGLKIGKLAVYCNGKRAGGWPCHHQNTMPIAGLPDDLALADIERRLRCAECGTLGVAEVRPDWSEVTGQRSAGPAGWMKPPSPQEHVQPLLRQHKTGCR